MYPRSFLCEEAKIKQRTPLKKELCEIGEEVIWESQFTSFISLGLDSMVWWILKKRFVKKKTIFSLALV